MLRLSSLPPLLPSPIQSNPIQPIPCQTTAKQLIPQTSSKSRHKHPRSHDFKTSETSKLIIKSYYAMVCYLDLSSLMALMRETHFPFLLPLPCLTLNPIEETEKTLAIVITSPLQLMSPSDILSIRFDCLTRTSRSASPSQHI
ncbi:hypothetical protein IQ07DRAFT_295678 [Pyrenochaeta sp. DS3sAY3a]|nr:hypothetical protein IQ07DRAFT_295678 [Pyrenochaeta sp. DS3sAY3a]